MRLRKPGRPRFGSIRRASAALVLLLLTAATAAAQGPWTTPPGTNGKVRIVSTAADALCVGGSGASPASSACTGGLYAGPAIFNTSVRIGTTTDPGTGGLAIQGGLMWTGQNGGAGNKTLTTEHDWWVTDASTVTLSSCTNPAAGREHHVYNYSTGSTVTVQRAGTDVIGAGALTSITLGPGDALGFLCIGTIWIIE